MGLFDFFRKKRKVKVKRKKRSRKSPSKAKQTIKKTKVDIENLQTQMGTINIALNKHNDELLEHKRLINQHSRGLEKLEQIVTKRPISPSKEDFVPPERPTVPIEPSPALENVPESQAQKFDIARFSGQERKILSVFFQNQDMALSYVDIARSLDKSPNTIKNQMRQIRLKADLFDRAVDNDSRNRFKLKDGLRIEKYLNVH
jgi:DNA-binding CsgD family transcriptional regulator